ncbi:hypothetical protein Tsubulata_026940 [Turnera subulata]|uniref:non-specific serine/threonine protein kinase n=1 Tax=Turnera subulata TaxID=218843 RepID=A0A9Q0FYQ8_9ROSI|nr:hypothetical protein Tsubulata_026940 [Turnera subulata]
MKQQEWENTVPSSWEGQDPCGTSWEGITCSKDSRLTSMDLSYNKDLSGPIPRTIGNLKKLTSLSLNSNGFTGPIPASIGNLSHLYWLDLADNKLTGPLPVSTETTPGLDMLVQTKHFHLGLNQLSGTIPSKLFSSEMTLKHVLFERNMLQGSIPSTLALVQSLEVIRFDGNRLNGIVPSNLNNLTSVTDLYLSNNGFTGPLPNLTGMGVLSYLDMSNNSFDATDFPFWLSTLQSLTSITMESTNLEGLVPTDIFSLPNLQSVVLRKNRLNGTLDIGAADPGILKLIDLQSNQISDITTKTETSTESTGTPRSHCTQSLPDNASSYVTSYRNCAPPSSCLSAQISSPNCKCAYPYAGTLVFRAPSFPNLGNSTVFPSLERNLMSKFSSLQLPVDSVSLSNPRRDVNDYLDLSLKIFPSGQDHFNATGISAIGFVLSNQTYKPPPDFGPFENPPHQSQSHQALSLGLPLVALPFCCYCSLQGSHWDSNKSSGGVPQLKGARCFSFEELKKYTNNFSEANDVGSGGYGKVYRGTLPTGELIAIKRAQQGSMQGGLEFKTEIELLSRVHHKNVVSLLGFCFDRGEQMLIYEFVPNGSLKDSLSGKSGIRLDWKRRLKVALGAARGLAYLHELANPPIIHRDIKSTNILLDERLNAKVADFGLSKPMEDSERGHVTHVTTQVKGTMGYLDPEYYMTQQLTEKSDVYSFGVVMLELLTGRRPIERGKYIVREIRMAMDRTKRLYNLQELVDQSIGLDTTLIGLDKYVDLAMKCVQESGADRPAMGDVVKDIENILQLAGLNPNAESASTSESYEEASKGSRNPYSNEAFDYSGAFPVSKLEPQ